MVMNNNSFEFVSCPFDDSCLSFIRKYKLIAHGILAHPEERISNNRLDRIQRLSTEVKDHKKQEVYVEITVTTREPKEDFFGSFSLDPRRPHKPAYENWPPILDLETVVPSIPRLQLPTRSVNKSGRRNRRHMSVTVQPPILKRLVISTKPKLLAQRFLKQK